MRSCFNDESSDRGSACFIFGLIGFLLIAPLLISMSHLWAWMWQLTVKTPLRIVFSSVAAGASFSWLLWWWFGCPLDHGDVA